MLQFYQEEGFPVRYPVWGIFTFLVPGKVSSIHFQTSWYDQELQAWSSWLNQEVPAFCKNFLVFAKKFLGDGLVNFQIIEMNYYVLKMLDI